MNELGIPEASFASTDVIVTMGLVRPGGGLGQVRRITEVAEVVRTPEGLSFLPMLTYDGGYHLSERRMPILARIAAGWGMDYQEGMENLRRRIAIRGSLLEMGREDPAYLSPAYSLQANEYLWQGGKETGQEFIDHLRGR